MLSRSQTTHTHTHTLHLFLHPAYELQASRQCKVRPLGDHLLCCQKRNEYHYTNINSTRTRARGLGLGVIQGPKRPPPICLCLQTPTPTPPAAASAAVTAGRGSLPQLLQHAPARCSSANGQQHAGHKVEERRLPQLHHHHCHLRKRKAHCVPYNPNYPQRGWRAGLGGA